MSDLTPWGPSVPRGTSGIIGPGETPGTAERGRGTSAGMTLAFADLFTTGVGPGLGRTTPSFFTANPTTRMVVNPDGRVDYVVSMACDPATNVESLAAGDSVIDEALTMDPVTAMANLLAGGVSFDPLLTADTQTNVENTVAGVVFVPDVLLTMDAQTNVENLAAGAAGYETSLTMDPLTNVENIKPGLVVVEDGARCNIRRDSEENTEHDRDSDFTTETDRDDAENLEHDRTTAVCT